MNTPPLPGQHLHAATESLADPRQLKADVDGLLSRLGGSSDPAQILEQAHDVLVRALATVDKI